jgi:hypothetical protein
MSSDDIKNSLEDELQKLKNVLEIELEYIEDSLNGLERIYSKEDFDILPDEILFLYNDLLKYQSEYSRGELHHHGLDVNFEPFKKAIELQEQIQTSD